MPNESPSNGRLTSVWQNQASEGIRMSIDEIRRRAGKFQKTIYWRNAREYVAGLLGVVFFGLVFWFISDALTRVSCGLIIVGVVYVMWHLQRRGSSHNVPEDLGLASGIEFYRRELERQRDLLQSVWWWYLGPMIPGCMTFMVAQARSNPGRLGRMGRPLALFALVLVLVWWLNHRAARRLQSRIDELDALEKAV